MSKKNKNQSGKPDNRISQSLQRKIVGILKKNPGQPLPRKQISHFLNIKKSEYAIFENSLNELVRDGRIKRTKGHNYMYQKISRLTGELSTARAGYGFVSVEGLDDDIFIARDNLNTAFDRDVVEVQLYASSSGKRTEGFVTRVVSRFRSNIVGTYRQTEYYSYVIPDSPKIYRDIVVNREHNLNAKDGQKVLVEFEKWDSDQHNPEGRIVDVLGDPGDPGVDVVSVAYSYNLPVKFGKEIEKEAEQIDGRIGGKDLQGRLDLRDLTCFTIDPVDARDFDDAVSLEELDNGHVRLGVHIADVGHFVQPKTKMDKEAYDRGTSVYLVDRVIPMLPERLSNNLCSLRPKEDRLSFSCLMEIDKDLNVVDYTISPSIIHSRRRYNYEEFQEIYDQQKKDPYLEIINRMFALSKRLTQQRFAQGSIDFETPEVRFVLDKKGQPVDVIPKKRLLAHRLVEEFMLMANKTVARHVRNISPNKGRTLPFLYRVHEKPDEEKMSKFFNFLKALNVKFKPVKRVTSKWMQGVLESISGTPEETIIEEVALRSMMKAVYSEQNIGHFGLCFDDYTHFTSPIRRYPDLVVHRLLRMYAKNDMKDPKALNKEIKQTAEHCSKRERLAVEAERESIKLKQCEYIQKHIGDTFHGFISGVTSFGIFVEIEENYIEGLVQMTNMTDDFYIYDETTYSMTGKHSGRHIRLGDRVEIRVEGVNLEKREINFKLLEDPDFEGDNKKEKAEEAPKPKGGKKRKRGKKAS